MKIVAFVFASFLLAGQLHAQVQLSLADAIAVTLKNNYDIQIVHNRETVAQNNNSWGTAGGYPTVRFSATGLYQTVLGDNSTFKQVNPGLNLSWTIFSGFRISTTKQKLEHAESFASASTQQQVENTMKDAILTYYGVLMEAERTELNASLMAISRDRYLVAKARQELGAAVTFDVLQAKNNYLTDSANYLSQKQTQRNAMRMLSFVMADTTNTEFVLTEKFEIEKSEFQLTDLVSRMEQNNKSLQTQRLSMEMANKDISIAKSAWYPNLVFNSGLNYTWQSSQIPNQLPGAAPVENEAFNWSGSLTLSWTIFDGFNRKRNIQNAQVDYQSAQLNIEKIRHNIVNQISNQLDTYGVRQELFHVSEEAAEAAKLNLQIAKEKFQSGAINSFNYRDVQNIYMNASQAKLIATFNLVNSRVEIMRLIGEIVNTSDK